MKKKTFLLIIELIFIVIMTISAIKIYLWCRENKKNQKLISEISQKITIEINQDNGKKEYIVDFKELKQINPDTKAWIKVEGTDIEFPVVQTTNNEFYLTHSFDKTYNSAGWIFMDSTNRLDNTDKNIVIYGHNRRDSSMFGTLKNVLNEEWYNNEQNTKITFITENEKYIYKVFSVYKVAVEDYYIKTNFNEEEFEYFIKTIKSRSIKKFETEVTKEDTILTLSTCDDNNKYRIVLHAKEEKSL